VRSVANNEDVIEALHDSFGAANVLVHTGQEPLLQQLLMFARAKVVVAAHGAGMANLIVAPADCHLVMLPMWPMSDNSFIHLPAALGLRVTLLTDIRSYYYGNFGEIPEERIAQIVAAARDAWGASGHPTPMTAGGAPPDKSEL
jgi:hypothetical protein